MTPQAPRPKGAAAAAASRATTEQFNLPNLDEMLAPLAVAKRRRIQETVTEVEISPAPGRPKRAAPAPANRSITNQYSLTSSTAPPTGANARGATRFSGESRAAPSPTTPPTAERTRGYTNAVLAPATPPPRAISPLNQGRFGAHKPPIAAKDTEYPAEVLPSNPAPQGNSEPVPDEEGFDEEAFDDDAVIFDEDYNPIPSADSNDEGETDSLEPANGAAPVKIVVGDNGLVHVARAPKDIPFVLTGPLAMIKPLIQRKVRINYRVIDAKFPGVDRATLPARSSIWRRTWKDYSSHIALRSRGGSIEAFYPFILREDQPAYHEGVNIGMLLQQQRGMGQ
ncbi:hypothetical protein F5144DRAFT_604329 [Chaetomium tenue]|uniref:Uncharacterized protein n=1 Tax=Chaetomium tenue TaxID=1854479 RepID=A0ACB7P6A8_9PEZI|nr:hypothetical protein F5144DRAFT_604329 [Chaetomium globosum]